MQPCNIAIAYSTSCAVIDGHLCKRLRNDDSIGDCVLKMITTYHFCFFKVHICYLFEEKRILTLFDMRFGDMENITVHIHLAVVVSNAIY